MVNIEFDVHFCETLEEAQKTAEKHPRDVVVLKGAKVPGLKMSVVRVGDINKLYEQRSGQNLTEYNAQLTPYFDQADLSGGDDNLVLYARKAAEYEKSSPLQGALVLNLPTPIMEILNKFELCDTQHPEKSVYQLTPVERVIIDGQEYSTEHIDCYGQAIQNIHEVIGAMEGIAPDKIRQHEWRKIRGILKLDPNDPRAHAWWPETINPRREKVRRAIDSSKKHHQK